MALATSTGVVRGGPLPSATRPALVPTGSCAGCAGLSQILWCAIPSSIGKLAKERGHIRLDAQADDLDWFARELARLKLAFEIIQPKALKTALLVHVQRLLQGHG